MLIVNALLMFLFRFSFIPIMVAVLSTMDCLASDLRIQDEAKSSTETLDKQDSSRRSFRHRTHLDESVREVAATLPEIINLFRIMDRMAELQLEVDSREKADEIAPKLAALANESLGSSEQMKKELQKYISCQTTKQGTAYSAEQDPLLKKYNSVLVFQGGLIGVEIPTSILMQGFLTPVLQKVIKLPDVREQPIVPMSLALASYWNKKIALLNQYNRILYSLKTNEDIPRVKKEIDACNAALEDIEKKAETIYPLKDKKDKEADQIMRDRLNNGAMRITNVMYAVLKSRSTLKQPDGSFLPQVKTMMR